MTAVSLLFLLLLAMASFLVYRAVQHITGRFFPSDAGGFSGGLHLLRRSLFLRRRAQAGSFRSMPCAARNTRAASPTHTTPRPPNRRPMRKKQRAASAASWQEGYGAGFAAGFSAARAENGTDDMQTETPPPDGQERVPPQTDGALTGGIPPSDDTTDGGAEHPGLGAGGDDTSDEGKHPPGSGPYGTVRGQRRYIGGRGARRHPGGHDGLLHGGRQRPAPGPELLLFEAGQRGALMRRVGGAGPAALFQMRLTRRKAYPLTHNTPQNATRGGAKSGALGFAAKLRRITRQSAGKATAF